MPTIDVQVGASADDGYSTAPATFCTDCGVVEGADSSGNDRDGFARFTNVAIPRGATIIVAYITPYCNNTTFDGVGVKTNIYFNDIDDAVSPTNFASHAALARTTAFTPWDDVDFPLNQYVDSPSIVDVIQEIIDRGSWASGNAMVVLIDDDGSTTNKFYIWDKFSRNPMKLHVEYVLAGGIAWIQDDMG